MGIILRIPRYARDEGILPAPRDAKPILVSPLQWPVLLQPHMGAETSANLLTETCNANCNSALAAGRCRIGVPARGPEIVGGVAH
jgi:hypothetical protein